MLGNNAGTVAFRLVPAALFIFLLSHPPANAADFSAGRFIDQLNAALDKGFAAGSTRGVHGVCESIAGSSLDLAAMSRVASAGAIEKMDVSQRESFRAALLKRIVRECVAYAPEYLRHPVMLAGSRVAGPGEWLIGTQGQGANDTKVLMWRVRSADHGRYLATDLLVDGRSAMLSLKEQSTLSLERSPDDFAALIATVEH